MAELVVFVLVGAVSLGSALAVVLLRNAVHAALMLVVNFFTIAVFYAVLEAQFLAVIQIIVYAGAIMVLFLFVLMLLGISTEQVFTERLRGQKPAAILLGLALFAGLGGAVAGPYLGEESACGRELTVEAAAARRCVGLAEANAEGNVVGVGRLIFTDYVWPFEVMSVLLVIAALGAMVIGRRREALQDLVDVAPPEARVPASEQEDLPVEAGER